MKRFFTRIGFGLFLLGLIVGLYWKTYTFLYVWDDAPHFLQYIQPSLWEIWINHTGYGYYRPLTFTLLKVGYQFYHWSPAYFYVVAQLLHLGNALLIGSLAYTLTSAPFSPRTISATASEQDLPRKYAFAAAFLFAVYPFAALVLTSVPSINHTLVLFFTLMALWASFRYLAVATGSGETTRQGAKWCYLVLAWVCTFLAPFTHEYGITAGALVAWMFFIAQPQKFWRRLPLLATFPLLNVVFLSIWLMVPKTGPGVVWLGWKSVLSSALFFVQGFTYILQPLGQRLILRGWDEIATVGVVAALSILSCVLILGYKRQWRILAAGFGWLFLSILPSVIALPYNYIFPSMRLHYFPGVGGVLILSATAITVAQWIPWRSVRRLSEAGIVLVGAIIPIIFIYRIVWLHDFAMQPVRQAVALVKQHPTDSYAIINTLDWISYRSTWYPLGHEGVVLMPNYVLPSQVVAINTRTPVQMQELVYPPIQNRLEKYYYGLNREEYMARDEQTLSSLVQQYDRILVMEYQPQAITVEDVGTIRQGTATPPPSYLAQFEEKVFLQSAQAELEESSVHVVLNWKYLGPDPSATIFRHLLDCDGNVIAQADGHMLGRIVPFQLLPIGAEIRDERVIPLDKSTQTNCYQVQIGLYRPDGTRLIAKNQQNEELKDAAIGLDVTPR